MPKRFEPKGQPRKNSKPRLNTWLLSTGVFVVSAVSAVNAQANDQAASEISQPLPASSSGSNPSLELLAQGPMAEQDQPVPVATEAPLVQVLADQELSVPTSLQAQSESGEPLEPQVGSDQLMGAQVTSSQPEEVAGTTSVDQPEEPAGSAAVSEQLELLDQVLAQELPARPKEEAAAPLAPRVAEEELVLEPSVGLSSSQPVLETLTARSLLDFLEAQDALPAVPNLPGLRLLENHVHLQGLAFFPDQEPAYPLDPPAPSLDLGNNRLLTIVNQLGNFIDQWRRISNGDALYIYQQDAQARHRLEAIYRVTAWMTLVEEEAVPPTEPSVEPAPVLVPEIGSSSGHSSETPEVPMEPIVPTSPSLPSPTEPVPVPLPLPDIVTEPADQVPTLPAPDSELGEQDLANHPDLVVSPPVVPSLEVTVPVAPLPAAEGLPAVSHQGEELLANPLPGFAPPLLPEDTSASLPVLSNPVVAEANLVSGEAPLFPEGVGPAFGQEILNRVQVILGELNQLPGGGETPSPAVPQPKPNIKTTLARFDQAGRLVLRPASLANHLSITLTYLDGRELVYVLTKKNNRWTGLPEGLSYQEADGNLLVDRKLLKTGLVLKLTARSEEEDTPQVQTYRIAERPADPAVSHYEDSVMIRPAEGVKELVVQYTDSRDQKRRIVARLNRRGKWVSLSNFFVDQGRGTLLIPVHSLKNQSDLLMTSTVEGREDGFKSSLAIGYDKEKKTVDDLVVERLADEQASADFYLIDQ